MVKKIVNKLAEELPFDQYSRQKIVSYLIEESFRDKSKKNKFKIIDIGGHLGKTAEFQPNDKVTILDVYDENYENYVQGDATGTSFDDDSFDIACSFDVLEHIPRNKRQSFIDEAIRISKIGVFLAVPIDIDEKVSSAEIKLNNFHLNLTGTDHVWLKEHIDYRIPNEDDVTKLVKNSGASLVSLPSNQIGDWQLMQMLLFSSSVIPDIVGEVNDINTWYNHNTLQLDSSVDIGYRKIIFISKNKEYVKAVQKAIDKIKMDSSSDDLVTINKLTFEEFTNTFSLINKKFMILIDKYQSMDKDKIELIDEMALLKERLKGDEHHIVKLTREMDNIQSSKMWKMIEKIRTIIKFYKKS